MGRGLEMVECLGGFDGPACGDFYLYFILSNFTITLLFI